MFKRYKGNIYTTAEGGEIETIKTYICKRSLCSLFVVDFADKNYWRLHYLRHRPLNSRPITMAHSIIVFQWDRKHFRQHNNLKRLAHSRHTIEKLRYFCTNKQQCWPHPSLSQTKQVHEHIDREKEKQLRANKLLGKIVNAKQWGNDQNQKKK